MEIGEIVLFGSLAVLYGMGCGLLVRTRSTVPVAALIAGLAVSLAVGLSAGLVAVPAAGLGAALSTQIAASQD